MPELPEVITVSKHLSKRVSGLKIKSVDVNLDKIIKEPSVKEFKKELIGKTVIKVKNIGKWIVFDLNDNLHLIVHLRLEGKFRTGEVGGINPKHDHVIIHFDNGINLFFNDTRQFGTFHLLGKNYLDVKPLKDLGQYLYDINIDELYKRFKRKSIPIKTAMLDQTIVIGLGNIYINEALWKAKINPETPTNQLTKQKLQELTIISDEIMKESEKLGGSSIATYSSLDGVKGKYQDKLIVHGKNGNKCPRCYSIIEKIKVNGRGTYYCPKCQKK